MLYCVHMKFALTLLLDNMVLYFQFLFYSTVNLYFLIDFYCILFLKYLYPIDC